jgi:hypothetical protein
MKERPNSVSEPAYISLSNGMVAQVDADMVEELSKHRWRWMMHGNYACRQVYTKGGAKTRKVSHIFMHRVVVGEVPPGMVVDHIDGNGLNNMRSNLRICTQAQNTANQKRKSNATQPYRGVCVLKDGRIKGHFRKKTIGFFSSIEEAARAYDSWAAKYFGEYARLNFPNEKPGEPYIRPCVKHRWHGGDRCMNCGIPPHADYRRRLSAQKEAV